LYYENNKERYKYHRQKYYARQAQKNELLKQVSPETVLELVGFYDEDDMVQ